MALVNEVFATYEVRVKGLSGEGDDLVSYLVLACDYETSVDADEIVTCGKVCKKLSHFI